MECTLTDMAVRCHLGTFSCYEGASSIRYSMQNEQVSMLTSPCPTQWLRKVFLRKVRFGSDWFFRKMVKYAVICASNQNRSMEAHNVLRYRHSMQWKSGFRITVIVLQQERLWRVVLWYWYHGSLARAFHRQTKHLPFWNAIRSRIPGT